MKSGKSKRPREVWEQCIAGVWSKVSDPTPAHGKRLRDREFYERSPGSQLATDGNQIHDNQEHHHPRRDREEHRFPRSMAYVHFCSLPRLNKTPVENVELLHGCYVRGLETRTQFNNRRAAREISTRLRLARYGISMVVTEAAARGVINRVHFAERRVGFVERYTFVISFPQPWKCTWSLSLQPQSRVTFNSIAHPLQRKTSPCLGGERPLSSLTLFIFDSPDTGFGVFLGTVCQPEAGDNQAWPSLFFDRSTSL